MKPSLVIHCQKRFPFNQLSEVAGLITLVPRGRCITMANKQGENLVELISQFRRESSHLLTLIEKDDQEDNGSGGITIATTEKQVDELFSLILEYKPHDFDELSEKATFIIEEISDGMDMTDYHRKILDVILQDVKNARVRTH